uniref:LAM_G_DOMAIN domain-containing protein n=1 Tax=Brugia timori TaxID=42155 RepID=A0A0R3QD29_9BILA
LVAPPYDKGFMVPVIPDGNTFKGEFIPKREGVYELDVFQKGDRIAGSPFSLTVIPQVLDGPNEIIVLFLAQINIWGRGLEPHGIQSGEEVIVYADYSGSLLGPPHMRVRQLSGKEISVSETIDENLHLKIFKYRPQDVGIYEVDILLDGKHIDESPYKVHFEQDILRKLYIYIKKCLHKSLI